ncbi:MAG: hypothetical protein R8K22_02900, partial [Mariprofundaceae bacterium]
MKRILYAFLFLSLAWFPSLSLAVTETLDVHFLPLNEAVEVVRTQLSKTGRISALPSRRILVVEDDKKHLKQAKKLLQKLDQPLDQFVVEVSFDSKQKQQKNSTQGSVSLPGGWVRIEHSNRNLRSGSKQRFNLRVVANKRATIEAGVLRAYRQETRLWLAGHGLIDHQSVEIVPITSGFYVQLWRAGDDQVRIRLRPWMRRTSAMIQGTPEILIDLGTTTTPRQAPSNQAPIRLNASPSRQQQPVIEMAGAATELTIPVGETITIAASHGDAEQLGKA